MPYHHLEKIGRGHAVSYRRSSRSRRPTQNLRRRVLRGPGGGRGGASEGGADVTDSPTDVVSTDVASDSQASGNEQRRVLRGRGGGRGGASEGGADFTDSPTDVSNDVASDIQASGSEQFDNSSLEDASEQDSEVYSRDSEDPGNQMLHGSSVGGDVKRSNSYIVSTPRQQKHASGSINQAPKPASSVGARNLKPRSSSGHRHSPRTSPLAYQQPTGNDSLRTSPCVLKWNPLFQAYQQPTGNDSPRTFPQTYQQPNGNVEPLTQNRSFTVVDKKSSSSVDRVTKKASSCELYASASPDNEFLAWLQILWHLAVLFAAAAVTLLTSLGITYSTSLVVTRLTSFVVSQFTGSVSCYVTSVVSTCFGFAIVMFLTMTRVHGVVMLILTYLSLHVLAYYLGVVVSFVVSTSAAVVSAFVGIIASIVVALYVISQIVMFMYALIEPYKISIKENPVLLSKSMYFNIGSDEGQDEDEFHSDLELDDSDLDDGFDRDFIEKSPCHGGERSSHQHSYHADDPTVADLEWDSYSQSSLTYYQ